MVLSANVIAFGYQLVDGQKFGRFNETAIEIKKETMMNFYLTKQTYDKYCYH